VLFLTLFLSLLVSALLQLVSHLVTVMWFPHTKPIPRYVMGIIGVLTPPSVAVVLAGSQGWDVVLHFWTCAASSGLAVVGVRRFGERLTEHRDKMNALERYETSDPDAKQLYERIRNAKTEEEC
jgi:hypothetical protein